MNPNQRGAIARLLREELEVPEGVCVACDAALPASERKPGRPRTLTCDDPECRRTYNTLWRNKQRELAHVGLKLALEAAARSVARANRSLNSPESPSAPSQAEVAP